MNDTKDDRDSDIMINFNPVQGQAMFLARNLTDSRFRWVVGGLGGGALAIWFLREAGGFVLDLLELQQQCGG